MNTYPLKRLGDYIKVRTGKLDVNASSPDGAYPFFTCSKEVYWIDSYSYDCECVLLAGNGDLNVKYYSGKFDAYQRTYIIETIDESILSVPYLYRFMLMHVDELRRNSIGGVIKYIKLGDITETKIPLPPLVEQRRITQTLDRAQRLIDLRKKQIEEMDRLAKAVFVDMFGDPVRNEKRWETCRLDSISDIVSGVAKGRKLTGDNVVEYLYLRVANVKDGHVDTTEIKTIQVYDYEVEKYRLKPGDIVLTEGGDPDKLGRGAVWDNSSLDCIHQNHVFRVRVNHEGFVPQYLSALIGSQYGKRYFLKAAKQTTGIASINMTQLSAFPVLVTPYHLQKEYNEIVHSINAKNDALCQALSLMEQSCKGLVRDAFV